jgi:DNA-binding winged helix-turn-helix (wHTH) protein
VGSDLIERFGPFSLDRQRRVLSREGADVHITPKAFDLLLLLIDEAPRVVAKRELHERVWPDTFVSDATLVGVIKELRRALGDRDAAAPIIRTVNRVGYGFARPVAPTTRRALSTCHWLAGANRRYPLGVGENVIGRDPESAVPLDAASVSRRHARITVGGAAAVLEDLKSKNGTKVGGVVVVEPVTLRDGDRITVGTVPLVYRESEAGLSTETHASAMDIDARDSTRRHGH